MKRSVVEQLVRNLLLIFTEFCMWLENVVSSLPVVCETDRK